MSFSGLKALIFDADGTLVDSEVPGLDVLFDMAAPYWPGLTRPQAHDQFRGVRLAHCVAAIAQQAGCPGEAFEGPFLCDLRDAMARRFDQGLQPMPGAHDLLHALAIPFCVATNGPRQKVEQTLAQSGLRHYFGEHVYCAYEVGSFKPEPGLFLHAAHALGVPPTDCAVVEDSLPGVQAALAAGMRVFSLLPQHLAHGVPEAQVTFVESLQKVGEHLNSF